MGRIKPTKQRRERPLPAVTHEPEPCPPDWPRSSMNVELTDGSVLECVRVTIHGVDHLLHATTARALSDALLEVLDAYNANLSASLGEPGMRQAYQAVLDAAHIPGTPRLTADDLRV